MNQFFTDATSDLQRASISSEEIGQIITRSAAQSAADPSAPQSNGVLEAGLLALLVKNNARAACRYNTYPIYFPAVLSIQQILPQNDARKLLIVQVPTAASGNIKLLFEQGPDAVQGLDTATYNTYNARALAVDYGSNNGRTLILSPAPTTPISILGANAGIFINVLIIEGT